MWKPSPSRFLASPRVTSKRHFTVRVIVHPAVSLLKVEWAAAVLTAHMENAYAKMGIFS
jgi:hypothetical protein